MNNSLHSLRVYSTTNLSSQRNITNLLLTITDNVVDIAKHKKFASYDSTQDPSKREASMLLVRYLQNDDIAKPFC